MFLILLLFFFLLQKESEFYHDVYRDCVEGRGQRPLSLPFLRFRLLLKNVDTIAENIKTKLYKFKSSTSKFGGGVGMTFNTSDDRGCFELTS